MTPYGIIISHETFEFFRYKHKRQRLVCILRKYKCLVGYSMVYHWKAIDSARLDEIDRLPKIFEKIRSDSPRLCAEGYRRCPLCRINRITEDVQQCHVRFSRRLSKITEDSLFAEPGGFPKVRQCSICRISPKIEVVRQRSIYLGGYPRCAKFSESHKRSVDE